MLGTISVEGTTSGTAGGLTASRPVAQISAGTRAGKSGAVNFVALDSDEYDAVVEADS